MNWQRGFCCLALVTALSFFSPSLLAQNCTNNQAPTANAGPDRSGNIGVALNFTGSGTDSDGTITSYWFNFGDGSFASWQSSPLASHSFASAGTFSVRLWVKDNCGAMSASDTAMVTITQAPVNPCANNTAPIANAGPDRAGNPNAPLLLTGYASTDIQNNISHYWWNFGDGQYTGWQSSAGVSHAFANTGNYSVRLWVKDSCGAMSAADTVIVSIVNPNPCAGNTPPNAVITSPSSGLINQSLNFSGLSSSDSTGTIQSYAWNFGDGQTANGVTVSHSYASAGNKTVTLTLSDSCGAQGSMTRTIVITNPDPCAGNLPPIAQASANPANANINQPISFSAAGSSDPNGSITSYSWNFGDGSSGSGLNASHAYANAGSFNAVLTVTDNCGATATKTISVSIINPNQGLVADFKVYKLTHVDSQSGAETWEEIVLPNANNPVELGLRIKFDGSSSSGAIASYSWNFGPGVGASGINTLRAFSTPGIQNVKLTIANANWTQMNFVTKTIHVADGMEMLDSLTLPNPNETCLALNGNVAWISSLSGFLTSVNVTNPTAVQQITRIPAPVSLAIAAALDKVYLASGMVGLTVYRDINTNGHPQLITTYNTNLEDGQSAQDLEARGELVYLAAGAAGFKVLDLTVPQLPRLIAKKTFPNGATARLVKLAGDQAFVADNSGKIYIFDVSGISPEQESLLNLEPLGVANLGAGPNASQLVIHDNTLIVNGNNLQLYFFNIPSLLAGLPGITNVWAYSEFTGGTTFTGMVAQSGRLYLGLGPMSVHSTSFVKMNIVDETQPYGMEWEWDTSWIGGVHRNGIYRDGIIFWGNSAHGVVTLQTRD